MTNTKTRIPEYDGDLRKWCRAMHELDLMFHFDDDPRDIVNNRDQRVFTDKEVIELDGILERIFKDHADPFEAALETVNR